MKKWSLIFTVLFCVAMTGFEKVTRPLPPVSYEMVKVGVQSSDFVLLDKNGDVLSRLRHRWDERALDWVPLSATPKFLTEILLQSEDRRFFDHGGVDGFALLAATWQRIWHSSSRGGSTLTMQLARRLGRTGNEHGWIEKLRQIRAASLLEKSWTKEQILEAYLNLAPFRGEIRGIAAASSAWFSKSAAHLSSEESAFLVAMLRGPNASSQRIENRACGLLPSGCEVIHQIALSAPEQPRLALEKDLAPQLAVRLQSEGKSGRFVSSIYPELQAFLTERLSSRLFSLKDQNVRDGAAVVLENSTGRVLAYIGSAGPKSRSPHVDGVRARRQAGSTLKPFLYARAFERRLIEPDSWIEDSAIDLTFPLGVYRPRNHDRRFHGWVRARTALGSSLNVPAVKLLRLLGEEDFWRVLSEMGFQRLAPAEDYGPALALGVADLTLWDLANAYRSLANEGLKSQAVFGNDEKSLPTEHVLSAGAVAQVREILASQEDRALGFGFDSILSLPFQASVKTGTSKDMRDNWCLGWSKDYTVGVWVGNFDGEPMWDVSGTTGAAPVWTETLQWLHEHRRSQSVGSLTRSLAASSSVAPVSFPHPRILYPPSGLVLAIDPEIPLDHQKLPLQVETAGRKNLTWQIGNSEKMRAQGPVLWPMRKGHHVIRLMDQQEMLEEVEVQVR